MTNTLKGKWSFDTNLLIYALNTDSPFHKQTKEIFQLVEKQQINPFISIQNITESVNVLTNIYDLSHAKAVDSLHNLLKNYQFQIITPFPATANSFFNLLKKHPKNDIYDLFLAATLLENDIKRLLTNNQKDFQGITKLTVVNPFSLNTSPKG